MITFDMDLFSWVYLLKTVIHLDYPGVPYVNLLILPVLRAFTQPSSTWYLYIVGVLIPGNIIRKGSLLRDCIKPAVCHLGLQHS